jgi:hypothetical protein
MQTFSKVPIHLMEEALIRINGKMFMINNSGNEFLYVQDPQVFRNIFSKDFNVFHNRRVSVIEQN